MRYDIHVTNADGSMGQFVLEQDDALTVGEYVRSEGMSYVVTAIRNLSADESADFDAVIDAAWRLGPVQASFQHDL